MKKIFLLLFLTCGVLFSSAEENKKLQINPVPEIQPNQRTPDYGSDILAYYQDGVIYLQFAYDMGEVEITVTNQSTGEQWQQTEDTTFGSALITTSTSAGNYYITIVTPDDCYYTGDFSL